MNPVTWFSIPSDDTAKAAEFYTQAFGWEIQPETKEDNPDFDFRVALTAPSDSDYTAREHGRVNGCLVKRAIGVQNPVVLVEVEDLNVAAEKIKTAGGKVVSEIIPMISLSGAFFLATDPDGNMLEIFKNN